MMRLVALAALAGAATSEWQIEAMKTKQVRSPPPLSLVTAFSSVSKRTRALDWSTLTAMFGWWCRWKGWRTTSQTT